MPLFDSCKQKRGYLMMLNVKLNGKKFFNLFG